MRYNPAQRRYNRRVLVLMMIYAVVLLGAVAWFKHHPGASSLFAYTAAVLPALPLIGVFVVLGRYLVEEADEYVRMLMVRQTLIATLITLSITTVWGFLESFGLIRHVDAYWAATIWFMGVGVGALVNRLGAKARR